MVKVFLLAPFLYLTHTHTHTHKHTHTHTHTQTHAQDVYRHANTHIFTVMAIVATMSNYSVGKKLRDFVFTTNT